MLKFLTDYGPLIPLGIGVAILSYVYCHRTYIDDDPRSHTDDFLRPYDGPYGENDMEGEY